MASYELGTSETGKNPAPPLRKVADSALAGLCSTRFQHLTGRFTML